MEPRQLVTLVKIHPDRAEAADRIVGHLAGYFAVLPAGFRSPEDPYISIDAGSDCDLQEAGRRVVAALEEIDADWRAHLQLIEPGPKGL